MKLITTITLIIVYCVVIALVYTLIFILIMVFMRGAQRAAWWAQARAYRRRMFKHQEAQAQQERPVFVPNLLETV